MSALSLPGAASEARGMLIRRVNQLYHDAAHDRFDSDHRYRHLIEARFWRVVCRRVLRHAGDHPMLAVDLACGTGFVTGILSASLRPCDRIIGVDLSVRAIARAGQKGRSSTSDAAGPEYCAADVSSLPLPDAGVDLVAMNAALHHTPDPLQVLREIDRVLKPGGRAAIGFEPNSTHFRSRGVAAVARSISRLAWYASPAQNKRRVGRLLGACTETVDADDSTLCRAINQTLIEEGAIQAELSDASLLDLVDPFARGAGKEAGFDPGALLQAAFPSYAVELLASSDYLGEMMRRLPRLRRLADGLLSWASPGRGSLFSCLVRKPLGRELS